MPNVELLVNGRKYGGWKDIRIVESIESLSGSFYLGVFDRWGEQEKPWPIVEEDACRVEIDGEQVIDGFVDTVHLSLSGNMGVSGYDKSEALVSCSAVLDRWTFRNATVLDIANQVASPFGINVSIQPGITFPKPLRKLVVNPGESPFDVIHRAAMAVELLAVSDGVGGIVLTRAASRRASPLVQGKNILDGTADYRASDRFRRYVVFSQIQGTDESHGAATRIRAEASDETVKRSNRVTLIQAESGLTADYARRRADWEARIRAARSNSVSVAVHGWRQQSGDLWRANSLSHVIAPRLGIDGDLLITQVDRVIGESGEVTELRLVRPDAFTPEPQAIVKESGVAWKELAIGAL